MQKEKSQPYFPKATIQCACGNIFYTGSVKEKIEIEICAACHPFYTGKEKLIDTAGRVEKFKRRLARSGSRRVTKKK